MQSQYRLWVITWVCSSCSDLPSLTDLTLLSPLSYVFRDATSMFPGEKPNAFTNTLSMIDLPSLRHIRGSGLGQFNDMNMVVLKSEWEWMDWTIDVSNDLEIGIPESFGWVHTITVENGESDSSTLEQFILAASYHFSPASYHDCLSHSVEEIDVNTSVENSTIITDLDLSSFPHLTSFRCASFAFPNVRVFKCENHPNIQSISIGKSSMCGKKGQFTVRGCVALHTLCIGSRSCVQFVEFVVRGVLFSLLWLVDCDALKTLEVGKEKEYAACFFGCHELRIESEWIGRGLWHRFECSGTNRSGSEVFPWGELSLDFKQITHREMMNRPSKPQWDGSWIARLLWRVLWTGWW